MSLLNAKNDPRPARGRWTPGVYLNECHSCGQKYIGDKRSEQCADCAYVLPKMKCEVINLPGMFVCGSRERRGKCKCGRLSTRLCDYPTGHGKTCDKKLCGKCAVPVGKNLDYCHDHPRDQIALALPEPSFQTVVK